MASSSGTLRLQDVGEFGLIARLQARIEARLGGCPKGLELGIGDDAAVWMPSKGAHQVVTTDALVENVHFRLATTSWADLGWKALAVNVSDLAAMGANPRHALVTLALRGDLAVADLEALYDGMVDLAAQVRLAIIGGDVVASPFVLINVVALGETAGAILRRDAGRPGDLLAVTGTLGASIGGLKLLEAGRPLDAHGRRLAAAHCRPVPRVAEAAGLVQAGVRCAMDVSDGLIGDTRKICERSGLRAVIDASRVPVDPDLREAFGDDALSLALGGGEDYELLCAAPEAELLRAQQALAALGMPLTVIGHLSEANDGEPLVSVVDAQGRPLAPRGSSWDHFGA